MDQHLEFRLKIKIRPVRPVVAVKIEILDCGKKDRDVDKGLSRFLDRRCLHKHKERLAWFDSNNSVSRQSIAAPRRNSAMG